MSSASIRETVARILVRLLEAYSPSGREEGAIEVFKEAAEELGFHKIWTDEAGNAHASTGNGPPKVALIGHIDTVPGKLPVSRENGVIRGRGAVDAKGPLATFLTAAYLAGKEDCGIQVSALIGEESDSPGARFLVETGFYVPYMVVGEPTNTSGVAIGYRGSASVLLQCRGLGGHSSSPEVGDSALAKLLRVVEKLGSVRGFSVAVVELHAWSPYENMLPTHAEARLDLRLGFEAGPDLIFKVEAPEDCRLEVARLSPPVRVRPQDPVPRALVRSMLQLGVRPRITVKRGTSDMNLLYPKCAGSIAAYGPGDPSLAHRIDDEWVLEKDLEKAVRILVFALDNLCNST